MDPDPNKGFAPMRACGNARRQDCRTVALAIRSANETVAAASMRRRSRWICVAVAIASAAAGLFATAVDAVAQTSAVCQQLESELARLQSPQAPVSDAAVRRMERARQAAQAAENRARRAGARPSRSPAGKPES